METPNVNRVFGSFTKPKLPAVHIDRSDLEASADCPQQGILRKKFPQLCQTTDALPQAGDIIHKIAEEAIKANEFSLTEAADYFANELPKALGRTDLQPDIIRAGKNLANELRRFGGNRILLCEEQIARTILPATSERGEVILTTCPDLVLATQKQDTIIVTDYKTGYKQRTNAEARDAMQTQLICWCLKAKFPQVETIHFWYIQSRSSTRAYARICFSEIINLGGDQSITVEQAIETRLLEAVRNYTEGVEDAWPTPEKCAICPVITHCRCNREAETEMLSKFPQTYLDMYIARQAFCEGMLKAMKDYVKNGRIIYGSGGVRFEYDPKPKYLPKITESEVE